MFANGGKRIKPTLIDRIQDRWGQTIYRHDERVCEGCDAPKWDEPERAEADRQARAGARSADRLSDHLDHGRRHPARHRPGDQGGRQASRRQDRHDQRRQGPLVRRLSRPISRSASSWATTSRARSAIRRRPRSYAAPIFRDFMKMALKDKPDVPFRVPPGIKLISVDAQDRHARPAAPARSWRRSSPAPRRRTSMSRRCRATRAEAVDRRCGPRRRHGHGRALLSRWPRALAAAHLQASSAISRQVRGRHKFAQRLPSTI